MSEALLQQAMDAARKRQASDADVVWTHDVNLTIDVAGGKLETLEFSEAIGLGVRLFTDDRRMGFAYTTALDDGLDFIVEAAWQNALASDPDEHNVLPEGAEVSDDDWTQESFGEIPVERKVTFCRELERKVLDGDPRIAHVQQASYGDTRGEFAIANSRGLRRSFRNAYCSCSVVAAAAQEALASREGSDSEMGWEWDFGATFEALRQDWVAAGCVRRATRALGGRACETKAMPVVLENGVAAQFLGILLPGLTASQVLKGKSLFIDRVGETVASEAVSLVDQNDLPEGLNRAPFDAEGVSAQRTTLLDAGTLKSFLQNTYTAHRMGLASSGNACRGGGFRGVPEVGATNVFLEPGTRSQEELLAEAGNGLFVTHAMGVHMADPISGDFSLGIQGLRIENGRLGAPVRGVTIAGNLKDFLQDVAMVGSDLRFFGATGTPSLLVSEMMVSGQ
ncbi:MAG: TldD/PmbA family protein [Nitrospiraceae bacterium]|nr:TldD/PmbA family protein [Nitrospiraceae bacterium]